MRRWSKNNTTCLLQNIPICLSLFSLCLFSKLNHRIQWFPILFFSFWRNQFLRIEYKKNPSGILPDGPKRFNYFCVYLTQADQASRLLYLRLFFRCACWKLIVELILLPTSVLRAAYRLKFSTAQSFSEQTKNHPKPHKIGLWVVLSLFRFSQEFQEN